MIPSETWAETRAKRRAEVVRVPQWERFSWLQHGFSTRTAGLSTVYAPGELNLGFTAEDDSANVRANRILFQHAITGEANADFIAVRQMHGVDIRTVRAGETGLTAPDARGLIEADGLITQAQGVLLAIQVADCVPVLVADTKLRAVAAFHAGWRGTVAGIVEQGVARMMADFGSHPQDLIAAIGPSIGTCCYTVGEAVREEFSSRYPYSADLFSTRADGLNVNLHLDLAEANRRQLLAAGLSNEAITLLGECSACSRMPDGRRKYFSHRAEDGVTGRMMAGIAVVA